MTLIQLNTNIVLSYLLAIILERTYSDDKLLQHHKRGNKKNEVKKMTIFN